MLVIKGGDWFARSDQLDPDRPLNALQRRADFSDPYFETGNGKFMKQGLADFLRQCFNQRKGLPFPNVLNSLCDCSVIDCIGYLITLKGGLIVASEGKIDQKGLRLLSFRFSHTASCGQLDTFENDR